jgi:cullin-4
MQKELVNYANDYKLRHSGHALSWDHALGTATLKARFDPGYKDLSVSLYQAVVLLLFNDAVEIPFADIMAQTRMGVYFRIIRHFEGGVDSPSVCLDDDELRRTLQSLACGKKKVLTKIPPGKDVNDGDVFKFNADFKDERLRVHINSIQAKVTVRLVSSLPCIVSTSLLTVPFPCFSSPKNQNEPTNP